MKAVILTGPQQTQAATNKAAVAAARAALQAAVKTQEDYLRTSATVTASDRVQLSDDGTTVIVG